MEEKPLAVYIHIPFCKKKCAYCDFLSAPAALDMQKNYVEALKQEIRAEAARLSRGEKTKSVPVQQSLENTVEEESGNVVPGYAVSSIFFGGGTPSILPAGMIKDILLVIRGCFRVLPGAEITIECNPGTIDRKKLSSYGEAGINRLSLGLQSADDRELALLGRIHTYAQFEEGYRLARETGFGNINVDLMGGLPGQTVEGYKNTIKKVLALAPEHISAYSLILEEGTPFFEIYGNGGKDGFPPLPDEDTERGMYQITEEMLSEAGYARYEISNYAKPGFECRHNMCYWRRQEYIGFGLGAASLLGGERFARLRVLSEYVAAAKESRDTRTDRHKLSRREEMEEFMFLGLRMMCGVGKKHFREEFGIAMEDIYGKVLEKYQTIGLLTADADHVALTPRGIDVSNAIFCDFLLD